MTKYKTVEAFLADQSSDHQSQIELLRSFILEAEPSLEENIKWNAPNYVFQGVDRITFSVLNKEHIVKVILHKGAKEKEDTKAQPIMDEGAELITWNSNIRGTLSFPTLEYIHNNHQALVRVFKKWLSL